MICSFTIRKSGSAGEYQHFEKPSAIFFEVFLSLKQRNTRYFKHPLDPPIRARPPVEVRGVVVGVAAVIKTGYATLSRNKRSSKC